MAAGGQRRAAAVPVTRFSISSPFLVERKVIRSASPPGVSGGLLLGSENPVDCLFALDPTVDGPHGPAEGEELLV